MFISIAQAAEAAVAHAAEAAVGHAAEAAGHAEHGGIFSEAETWVAITWVIVVALLARPIFRGITAALDLRREKIRVRIADAERLRSEAQDMLAAYQKKQRDALKEAQEIIDHAKAEAERLAVQSARDLDEMLKRREQQAIERISQAEAEALREVRNTAIDIAIAATRKLIAEALPADRAAALIDAAIKDLPKKLH